MREKKLPPPTPSEAAFERVLAEMSALRQAQDDNGDTRATARKDTPRHPELVEGRESGPEADAFLDGLYARSREFLDRDAYATIGDASGFNTKIVGVTFEGRQDIVGGVREGAELELRRDPDNAYDPNAIGVWFGALQLGFLKREIALRVAPNIDAGERYTAAVTAVTGGGTRSVGINVYVTRFREAVRRAATERSAVRREDVLHALIGERPLREAQRAVLERLEAGCNTLAVLGTGRGKSLCFQYPAAVRALERGAKTVVLYPLRALANDQYEALIGVDEAHHLSESTHRPAYQRVGEAIAALGSPQVLALTATAGDEAFARIRSALRIDAWVIDPTVRDNLHVVDARGTSDKLAYIERVIGDGAKAIVYCNSRAEATKTAEKLRAVAREGIAFYHAGVASAERAEVERYFREGAIRVVVATSAFGEGIDLPDVRHVFLYHMNFDFTEFNQQAGRAGRDGADASIHLLFGEKDRRINDFIIEKSAPTLETLRRLYAAMKRLTSDGTLRTAYADVAATLDFDRVDGGTVSAAVRIGADDDGKFVRFLPVEGKVDLTATERYAEGLAERDAFARFCEIALTARPEVLESLVDRPIYPSGVALLR